MSPTKDSRDGMWGAFGFITKIKYGGVIGKFAAIVIVYLLTLCVAIAFGHAFYSIIVLAVAAALAGLIFTLNKIEKVFSINPEMATLEGTEVIRYRQNELASKNHPMIAVTEIITEPELALSAPHQPAEDVAQEEV